MSRAVIHPLSAAGAARRGPPWARGALALLMALSVFGGAHAQTPAPSQVRSWAAACMACHGNAGQEQSGIKPLAGADREQMLGQLRDFKAGRSPSSVMGQLAQGYGDDELRAIADHLAGQKP